MKALIISEPGCDGVFRHVEGLIKALVGRGWRVLFAYSSTRGSSELAKLVAFVETSGGFTVDMKVGNRPCMRDFRVLCSLVMIMVREKPDVIHGHSSKGGALARFLSLVGASQCFLYTPNAYYGMDLGKRRLAWLYNLVESVLGHIGYTINVSSDEELFARDVLGLPTHRLTTIQNGVDTDRFSPPMPAEKNLQKRLLGVSETALVLGTVGRFSEQKDYYTFYETAIDILVRYPEIWIVHVGAGKLHMRHQKWALEAGVSRRIIRREYSSEMANIYKAFDVFMVTSKYEGLSFAVLEALACNLPVVISKAPGNTVFLRLGLSHVWGCEIGDVVGFRNAIEEWKNLGTKRRSVNHRDIIKKSFSASARFRETLAMYRCEDDERKVLV